MRHGGFSPLLVTVIEQLPHLIKANDHESSATVVRWLAGWVKLSLEHGGDKSLLEAVSNRIRDRCLTVQSVNESGFRNVWDEVNGLSMVYPSIDSESLKGRRDEIMETKSINTRTKARLYTGRKNEAEAALLWEMAVPPRDQKNAGLNQWRNKTFPEMVEDHSLSMLVYSLCSEHQEIRKQALIGLRHVHASIQVSYLRGHLCSLILLIECRNPITSSRTNVLLPWES